MRIKLELGVQRYEVSQCNCRTPQCDALTSQWQLESLGRNYDLQFKQVMPTEAGGRFDRAALYYTSDFIRVEGLDNDLMHNDEQRRD